MIKRVRSDGYARGEHLSQTEPFVLDLRTHDIPNTVRGLIRGLPPTCVALSLRNRMGPRAVGTLEREARRRRIRILWLF